MNPFDLEVFLDDAAPEHTDLLFEASPPPPLQSPVSADRDGGTETVAIAQNVAELDEFAELEALINTDLSMPSPFRPPELGEQSTDLSQESLDEAFADLEAIINSPAPLPPAPAPAPPASELPTPPPSPLAPDAPTPQSRSTASYNSATIRVELNRLEVLNNLVGELVTQENTATLQNQQLQTTINAIVQRFSLFEQIGKELQAWTNQSQKGSARLQRPEDSSTHDSSRLPNGSSSPTTAFDPLQMDSYSHLYMLVQSAMEEIVQQGEAMRDLTLIGQQTQQTQQYKQQTLRQVRSDLLWLRMLPLGEILQRFPRMVRDMSAKYRKQVNVELVGTNTLIDKAILEKLFDPLVHLVRNAFDHGIEQPDVRQTKGKPAQATIEIRAYHRGNQTCIEVRDDGRGIDVERIRARVVALNLMSADEADELSSDRLYDYLFSPGFSTSARVNELSGRGVGLDAVKAQVRALKGTISLSSDLGKGTTFTLRFPLTLTIADLLVFNIHANLMAIPVDSLVSIVSVHSHQIETIQGESVYRWNDQLVPLFPQSRLLQHYPILRPTNETFQAIPLPRDGKVPLLLINGESGMVALQVDQILQEQELVIKPFGSLIQVPTFLSGCTILGDGSVVPVIDGQALVSYPANAPSPTSLLSVGTSLLPVSLIELSPIAVSPIEVGTVEPKPETETERTARPAQSNPPAAPLAPSPQTILVVDDSLTARQALIFTLERVGYRVVQARDGREAVTMLEQERDIKAVFCDVEMPRMNGFEFLSHCRQHYADRCPPIIMLTSRGGDKHRQTAQELGATAYLTKPYLEQALLGTLESCLTYTYG